ncbi:hypothetical protein [Streptomyces sp. MB09-02B]|uniref:hypothetical protein n=1 Tax=Streptomyces sp. MB09-02B TaxID=3028667 RepID=UPI0029C0F8F7|nr:hypothetical protein [Streptomyces sp. MB09-02B]
MWSSPEPVTLDVTFLPHTAELLGGVPQAVDCGPLYSAVPQINARALEHDIHGPRQPLPRGAPSGGRDIKPT